MARPGRVQPGDFPQIAVRCGLDGDGDRDGCGGPAHERGRDGVGGERGGPDLVQPVHHVGAGMLGIWRMRSATVAP